MTFNDIKRFRVLCCTGCILLQACDESALYDDAKARVQTTQQAIRYGSPDENDDYRAVMGIAIALQDTTSIYCSGVLVGSHKLLTAAHCVTTADDFPFDDLYANGAIKVVAQYRAKSTDTTIPQVRTQNFAIEKIHRHAGYNVKTRIHDLAIVDLDPNADTSAFTPYAIAADPSVIASAIRDKSPVTYVGFGTDEDRTYGTRKSCQSIVDTTCPLSSAMCQKTAHDSVYDMPGGTVFDIIDTCAPCFGDSGGPVLIAVDGIDSVFAITAFGDDDCADFSASTLASEHRIWLNDQLSPQSRSSCQAMVRPTQRHNTMPFVFFAVFVLMSRLLLRKRDNSRQ